MDNEVTFGKYIAKNRKKVGLTQLQLGKAVGITSYLVDKIEHDEYVVINEKYLRSIAKHVNVRFSELDRLYDELKDRRNDARTAETKDAPGEKGPDQPEKEAENK